MEKGLVEGLKIDKLALDEEWELQPIKFIEAAEKSVKAQEYRDACKRALEVEMAECEDKIRRDPSAYLASEKPTEAAIKSAVVLDQRVQEAQDKLQDAVTGAKILDAVVQALDQRKKALENLTQLFLAGYYSRPYIPEEAKEQARERRHKKQVEGLENSLKRRKRSL